MKHFLLYLVLLLTLQVGNFAQTTATSDGDKQIWPDLSISYKLNAKVSVGFFGTVRLGRNDSVPVAEHIGGGVSFKLHKYLTLAQWYRFIAAQPVPGKHTAENRWFFDVTPRLPLPGGFVFSDRNRYEVRFISGVKTWRYRNRFQLEKALKFHDHQITPYIADELYYDSKYQAWTRSQFFVGMKLPVTKHFTLDSYYLKQNDGRVHPGYLQILGTSFRLDF